METEKKHLNFQDVNCTAFLHSVNMKGVMETVLF